LGFKQLSFRHIARALEDNTFSVFQRFPLLRHSIFPSDFRLQVNQMAQKYFLRTPSDRVRNLAARSAAYTLASLGSSQACSNHPAVYSFAHHPGF
jgi:hypothetical protein